MSEVKTMSETLMKRKIDNGSAGFYDAESIMVWSDQNPYKYRLYYPRYGSDGSPNGWVTDGEVYISPLRNPNAPFSDSFSDSASFASASSGSSGNKVVDGDNTRSYLNKIASAAATGATNLAVDSLTTAAKKGAKAAAVVAGTAALSEALKHPEYFPDKLQPLVPIANLAVNKIGKTIGKTFLGASKNLALKYAPAIAKAAARAGWNHIILPRITDYWNSVEPWLPFMIGAPIAAYGATKTVGSGLNLIRSGVESGTQAITRVLKPTRIEEPIDFDEKDNKSYSSSSSSWSIYDDRTVEQYLKDNPSERKLIDGTSSSSSKPFNEKDNMSYSSSSNYSSNSRHKPIINGSVSSDLFLLTDGKSSNADGKSSDSSLALVSAESEFTDDPWASADSVFDDSSLYSDDSEFIPPLPPAGGSGSLGRGRMKRRVIFLSFFRLKI